MNAHADLNQPSAQDDLAPVHMTVFVDRYQTEASIGVWDHERVSPQPLCISVKVGVENANGRAADGTEDLHSEVVCYQDIVETINMHLVNGHIDLVETLAQRVLASLVVDNRIMSIWLRIEKSQAITGAHSVGVELNWTRKK